MMDHEGTFIIWHRFHYSLSLYPPLTFVPLSPFQRHSAHNFDRSTPFNDTGKGADSPSQSKFK